MLEEMIKKTKLKDAIWIIIAAFAIVNFWRAIWGLLDIYLFPKNIKMSLLSSLIISLFILTIITLYRRNKR